MARFNLTILTTFALAASLGSATPAPAQHRGGGGPHGGEGFHGGDGFHGGPGHRPIVVENVFLRGGGYYPYWGYPGLGIDIGYGYGYGPPYPAVYQPVVVVPPPAGALPPEPVPVAPPPGAPPRRPEPLPAPTPVPADNVAHVHVVVPPDAALWFNGAVTTQTGAERDFSTPPLPLGRTFTYEVKARWMRDGRPLEQTFEVEVRPNKTTTVDFNASPPAKG